MYKNHIKIAFRNLWSSKLFTMLNVAGLTGGMVAAVFILLWVQNELSFDAYHKKSDRINRILTHLKISKEETWHWSNTPLPLSAELKKLPEIESLTMQSSIGALELRVGNQKIAGENAAYVDTNWFNVFDYQFIDGSAAEFSEGVRNIAMSEAKAMQIFGKADVAGEIVRIDTLDYTLAAVYKNNPSNSSFQHDFMLPMAASWADPKKFENDNSWNQFNYETFVVLRADTDRTKLGRKITSIISNLKRDDDGKPSTNLDLEVEPLTNVHFNAQIQGASQDKGDYRTTYIFLGLALVILLVACINYVNLTTARATVRSKEVGVKKLLGAKSAHLFGQFMTESILTCLVAFGVALGLIFVLLPTFNELTGRVFVLSPGNVSLWYVLIGTTLAAVLLTGIYPSLLLSSFKPFEILRGNNILGSTSGGFRKGLVIVQFTVTVVFLLSTVVVYQQMKYIREKNLGYDRSNVITFSLPWQIGKQIDKAAFKNKLLNESSIADVTMSTQSIVQVSSSTSGASDWDGRPKDFVPTLSQISAGENFQKMFGIGLKEGRWFMPNSIADRNNVVLNEAAVKKLKLIKPVIGRRFVHQGKTGIIIGVVKDFHFRSLRESIQPLVIYNDPDWTLTLYTKVQPGREAAAIVAIRKIWDEQIPNYTLKYKFLDETYDRLYKSEQRTASLFNIFAVIAVIISCLGLFGLATFTAERRVKEIGIRKVLGASVTAIVALLSTDFIVLVLISILVASPVGYYFMTEWLKGFEYKIELNWMFFALSGLAVVFIALFTISYQSLKAALTDPVKSLRAE